MNFSSFGSFLISSRGIAAAIVGLWSSLKGRKRDRLMNLLLGGALGWFVWTVAEQTGLAQWIETQIRSVTQPQPPASGGNGGMSGGTSGGGGGGGGRIL